MGMKSREKSPRGLPRFDEPTTIEEQRDFYKKGVESLIGCAIWTLENFGMQEGPGLVFVEDKDDPRHGQVRKWQEIFFDRLDEVGYRVNRDKYYAGVAAARKRKRG